MTDPTNMLDNLRVKVMSPDKSIRAKYSPGDGVLVESRPGAMRGHTESTLARQIEKTLGGIISGYDAARDRVRGTDSGAAVEDDAERARRRPFEEIGVSGKSKRGFVEVELWSTNGLRVRITPDAIARCGADLLMTEVNSALDEALHRYGKAARTAFDEVYNRKSIRALEGATNG